MKDKFYNIGEYAGAGLYEQPDRSLFYRKSLGICRFYENCELAKYSGEYLYPSGVINQKMRIKPDYLYGLTYFNTGDEKFTDELKDALNKDFGAYRSSVPEEHGVAGNMYTHSIPNYIRILKEGFYSYIDRINKIKDQDIKEGLLLVVGGIKAYHSRCVEYLQSVNANPMLIDALKVVPFYPAQNIYQAIVCWNFIMYLDNLDNIGCIEHGLLPFFNGENIVPYLENLYDNLDCNNGYSASVDCENTQLTIQCLLALKNKRRPMMQLFVDENTPDSVWEVALKIMKNKGGQPAFYNKELISLLKKRIPSIKESDLKTYCGGGCTESMFTGLSNVGSISAGINLLLILEQVIYSDLENCNTFADFYNSYMLEVDKVVNAIKKEVVNSKINRAKYNPLPMRTLLVDDCIDNGKEFNDGGARYNWDIINFAGIINVIDSLLAIKTLVYEQKKYSAKEITSFLKSNDENFLKETIKLSLSHGKDIKEVNDFGKLFTSTIFSMLEKEKIDGHDFLSSSIQFMSQVMAGEKIGATPDGRKKGAPLCDSLGAIFGKDCLGPTALLNSVTSLDLKGALGVPVVNFNVNENFSDEVLKSLILGYVKKGGVHLQITYASKEELIDAYAHPELHNNLVVRVGGYSEHFNKLSDELKKMIIERTIQTIS